MQKRLIALAASAVIVLGAVLLLVVKVKAKPKYEVSADKISKARSAYERRTRAEKSALPPPLTSRTRTRARTRRPKPVKRDDSSPGLDRSTKSISGVGRPSLAGARAMNSKVSLDRGGNNDLKKRMAKANRLYDRGAYEDAKAAALDVLKDSPRNIRMLRIVVSTGCVMGDGGIAKQYAAKLPKRDFNQMKRRCKHYNVEL